MANHDNETLTALATLIPEPEPVEYLEAAGNLPELEAALNTADIPNTGGGGSHYSQQQRLEAIGIYTIYGRLAKVEELTNIPARTLRLWRKTEWWQAASTAVCRYRGDRIDARMMQIQDLACDNVIDRLVRGDVGKSGDRYAMTGRNAAVIFDIFTKNLALSRNMPTSINVKADLAGMMRAFERASTELQADAQPSTRVVSEQPQVTDN